jgi:hypothetical protein
MSTNFIKYFSAPTKLFTNKNQKQNKKIPPLEKKNFNKKIDAPRLQHNKKITISKILYHVNGNLFSQKKSKP